MKRQAKRGIAAIFGSLVVILGIILIPYPGPGWLVVFAGLSILSTEFTWAVRLLTYIRSKYDVWVNYVTKQSITLRVALWLLTALMVIVTVWLVNGYGLINDIFHLRLHWLNSPLGLFN